MGERRRTENRRRRHRRKPKRRKYPKENGRRQDISESVTGSSAEVPPTDGDNVEILVYTYTRYKRVK